MDSQDKWWEQDSLVDNKQTTDNWWSNDTIVDDRPKDEDNNVLWSWGAVGKALRHGVHTSLKGYEDTIDAVTHNSNTSDLGNLVPPDPSYVSGHDKFTKAKGWGEKLSALPQMAVEGAPGLAVDVASTLVPGGILAKLATMGLLNAGRSFGTNAIEAAKTTQGPQASADTLGPMDYAKAGVASGTDALLDKVGIGYAAEPSAQAIKGLLPALSSIAGRGLKSGAINAGTNVASDVVRSGVIKGELPNPNDLVADAILGGTIGGVSGATNAARTISGGPEVARQRYFGDISQPEGQALLRTIKELGSDAPLSKDNYSRTIDSLERLFRKADTKASPIYKQVVEDNQPLGRQTIDSIGDTYDPTVLRSTLNKLRDAGVELDQRKLPLPITHTSRVTLPFIAAHQMYNNWKSMSKLRKFQSIYDDGREISGHPGLHSLMPAKKPKNGFDKARERASRTNESQEPPSTYNVSHVNQSTDVESTVPDSKFAYDRAIEKTFEARDVIRNDLKASVPRELHGDLDNLIKTISAGGVSSRIASVHINSFLRKVPKDQQEHVSSILKDVHLTFKEP
jgi:hypothetical protein